MKLRKNLFLKLFAAAVVLLCLLALPQNAQAASESDLTFKLNSDETAYTVSKCETSASGELVIPATYNGLPVTAISSNAFYGCSKLTSVTIPNSIPKISSRAFYGCSGLTSVTIPEGITEIGDRAFVGCTSLTSVTIPSTVTKIGDNPFTYSNSLKSLQVAKGNTVYHSAGNCVIETAKKTLIIGCPASQIPADGSVTMLGFGAFENCDTLTAITIPNTITVIDQGAFWDCDKLASITIPDSVTYIGYEAFYKCASLTEITIPSSVTTIEREAFGYCSKLTKLQVASGNPVYHSAGNCIIQTAKKTLIAGCPASKIPTDGSVTTIGSYAFYNCRGLTAITIPNTITAIENNAFDYCKDLTHITIPGSVTTIGNEAFSECGLTSVTIEKGVATIGKNAFDWCSKLTEITIPDSVTLISEQVFFYCSKLTTIAIPGSVSTIGKQAFYGCEKLTNVIYCGAQEQWDAVTIGEKNEPLTGATLQFHNYKNGACTYCPATNGVICQHNWQPATCDAPKTCALCQATEGTALGHNMKETAAEVKATCEKAGKTAVKTCANGCGKTDGGEEIPAKGHNLQETSAAVAPTCTAAGKTAVKSCSNGCGKTEGGETVPATGHNYVNGTCANCGQKDSNTDSSSGVLTFALNEKKNGYVVTACDGTVTGTVTIPATYKGLPVVAIGEYAFEDCYDMPGVTIPDSVTAIGEGAFKSCYSLTGIVIPKNATSIGQEAFAWCDSITSLQVASGNPVYHSADNCIIETASKTLVVGCQTSKIPTNGSVTSIGASAFLGCSNMTAITIPDCVTAIGHSAFVACTDLTGIVIPKGVTKIEAFTFFLCENLTSIIIPGGVTEIAPYAFGDCYKLSVIGLPGSVTVIGECAFENCTSLTKVIYCGTNEQLGKQTIGGGNEPLLNSYIYYHNMVNGVCTICQNQEGGNVCKHNWQAATCDTPKTCTLCGETSGSALGHNMKETAAEVKATCEKAGKTAVKTCANGCGKTEGGETVPATGHNYVNGTCANCGQKDNSVLTFVLNDYGNGYYVQKCDTSATGKVVIPATYNGLPVTGVGERAFWECTGVTSVVIEEGSLAIGAEAFGFCTGLKSITLPDSLLAIDMGAFWSCTSLTSLTIPKDVFSISNSVIGFCESLTTVQVAKENQTYHSAGNCIIHTENKTLIAACNSSKMPTDGSVTNLGYYAFAGCTKLTSYTLPNVITGILGNPFAHCNNLTTLKVASGNSVYHSAGNCIIETATKFLTVGCQTSKIPTDGSVTTIGFAAFENCNKLTSITIPSNVTIIGDGAFWGCDEMTSITIPGSVTGIGLAAFGDCTGLTKVTYCGTQEQWSAITLYEKNEALTNATLQLHNYKNGKCTICGGVDACQHSWTEATCTEAATCKLCGETSGTALGHQMVNGVCVVCGQGASLLGDANGDGKVNLRDAIMVLQASNGKDIAIDRSAADVNGDGKVNLQDAIRILKRANGNTTPFPAEK